MKRLSSVAIVACLLISSVSQASNLKPLNIKACEKALQVLIYQPISNPFSVKAECDWLEDSVDRRTMHACAVLESKKCSTFLIIAGVK